MSTTAVLLKLLTMLVIVVGPRCPLWVLLLIAPPLGSLHSEHLLVLEEKEAVYLLFTVYLQ